MESIFSASWDDLEREDVEAFLAEAGDETLLWEAKGGAVKPKRRIGA